MPLRIAYVSLRDPHDRKIWSGSTHAMYVALKTYAGEVEVVGVPRPLSIRLFRHLILVVRRLTRQMDGVFPSVLYSMACSRFFSKAVDASTCDVVFAANGATECAYMHTARPIFYLTDTTAKLQDGYYYKSSDLSALDRWQGNVVQQRALDRADGVLMTSDWAAQSAIADYHCSPGKITVIPFGANLATPPDAASAIYRSEDGRCRLLFVSADWKRKGGAIALDALRALRTSGIDAELTVVGCRPDAEDPHLRVIPFLNKNVPAEAAQLEAIYRAADFFLLPTRADCTPVVLCEASGYGIPCLSAETGGVSSIVKEGVNGFVLPLEAGGAAYAEKIAALWADPSAYRRMRQTTRERYDSTLNWKSWAESVRDTMLQYLAAHPATPGRR
jgi:glycosyltransferase involved in cell wall biosynthesis